jgi:hypothetical protein
MAEYFVYAVVIGVGATLVMDLWALLLKRCFGVPSLDFSMVGRWVGHLPRGRWMHASIAKSSPIAGEGPLGWGIHYAIGIVFAAMLLLIVGLEWARQPSLLPALTFGVLSVVAPFFVLQPAMGAGVAASRTPKPNVARLRSLAGHTVFGVGLYLTAWVMVLVGH